MAKKKKTVSSEVEKWLGHIIQYERSFSKWEARAEKVIRRYKDDQGATARNTTSAKFNILWSNVQTLSAATYAKLPKPDVSRRFRDNDPVGRVASLILERSLDYEVQHYTDYDFTLRASILDRFLPGRGTAWVRYEPHFRAMQSQLPTDGVQVTEDIDETQEELDYECAPVDYVHWRDFGHVVARTWDETTAVWRAVYMTRDAMVSRFGDELGNQIPLDAVPEEFKKKEIAEPNTDVFRGLIYEIWDKEAKEALWLSKSLGRIVDRRPDPLGLDEFFPCPKPLYATLTNDSLVPTPDFTLYQDQARELDTLADRIDGLVKALQVKGCYDASITSLGRLFTEAENTNLIPVKNWAAFAEKQGLRGAIELLDIKPIYEALQAAYLAMEQIKGQVYEITGVSDIVRGQGNADATATAERIKGQFASLRLKAYQDEVARYAAEIIQLKAQVICNKFAPQTILQISAAQQLSPQDQRMILPAMQLLLGERVKNPDAQTPNPLRSFRVEIESDSLVYLDDQENKESRLQFLQAQGQFIEGMVKVIAGSGPMAPALISPITELWKFGVQAFKVGKGIEGAIDEAAENMKKALAQAMAQPPQPDPAVIKEQIGLQREQMITQREAQLAPIQAQTEAMKAQAAQTSAQAGVIKANIDLQAAQVKAMTPQPTGPMQ